jgi:hypothetical protein
LTQGRCVFWFGTNGEAAGHNGVDEFEIAEFLVQDGAAPAKLIEILFGRVQVDA